MTLLKLTLGWLRRGLIWLLVFYWVGFLGYTTAKFVEGGLGRVADWYRHISTPFEIGRPFEWSWKVFLGDQILLFAITLGLWIWVRSTKVKLKQIDRVGHGHAPKIL